MLFRSATCKILLRCFPIPCHSRIVAKHSLAIGLSRYDTTDAKRIPFRDQASLHNLLCERFTGAISEAKEGKLQRSTPPPHLPFWPGRQYTNRLRIPQAILTFEQRERRLILPSQPLVRQASVCVVQQRLEQSRRIRPRQTAGLEIGRAHV